MTQSNSQSTTYSRGRRASETPAEEIIRWVKDWIKVPDGKNAGQEFILRDWQQNVIRRIYDHDTRRAIISVGRKNGKTALAAVLLLVHLCGPRAVRNTELYSTALSRDQAAVLFQLAAKIVGFSPRLRRLIVIRETIKQLYCPRLGTSYVSLSADASTAMGKSPIFLVHDELGQVQGPRHRLYDAMETATSAHERPLSIVISTQAPTDADLLSVLIDDAATGADPRTILELFTAPDELDPFAEETIKLANPAFGDFQNKVEVMAMAEGARRMPAREAEYRNLVLNQRVEIYNPFVSRERWRENGDPPAPLRVAYGGLDLSEANDLTAFVLISQSTGKFNVHPTFWLPEHGIVERSRQDRVTYDLWAQEGNLELTPGKVISYEHVATLIAAAILKHDVRKIGFDRYNMRYLRPWLIHAGLTEAKIDSIFVDFGQGWVSMSPALRKLEELLGQERIRHGMHPVLKMCAGNAVVLTDPKGNRTLDKKHSRGRIDGMVALAMAVGVADTTSHEKHVFSDVPVEQILEDA